MHCVLVLIASTPEFRKDTTHPPTNFILESYAKEEQATQLQGIEGMKEMLARGEEIRSDVVEVVKKSEVVGVEVVTSNVVGVEVVGSKCSQSRSSQVRCSRSRSSHVRCSRSSRELSTKEKREGASSRCLQPILAALTREAKTSEDERRKNVKVVESSTIMVKNVLVGKKGEKLVRKVRKKS